MMLLLVGVISCFFRRHRRKIWYMKPALLIAATLLCSIAASICSAAETIEPPAPRTAAEVKAVLAAAPPAVANQKLRPLNVVLVAGKKDHGKGEHDYPAWQKSWEPMMARLPEVHVATSFGRPEQKLWDWADLMVFYCWGPQFWDDDSYKQLDAYLARGGGLVIMHSAVICDKEPQKLADRIGMAWTPPLTKYRHGSHDLTFAEDSITAGFSRLHFVDEDYWPVVAKAAGGVKILATTPDDGGNWPTVWTFTPPKGRVFCTTLFHYAWTVDDPLARILLLRGMAWAANEPLDRFVGLATVKNSD